ncbi:MAG: hypothetical protein EP343_32280 [Deltaproteobacteria bacterium]|nr:MAG: hypothetical protein EP343_32280 [Deltaproteobacteria bacterium]
MNQQMQDWLKQHGQENVFAFFNKEQCEALLDNLNAQLAAEEELEQAARHVVAHSQFVLDEEPEPLLAEPEEAPATQQPARVPWTRSPLLWTLTSATCVCLFAFWSVLVYNYGANKGRTDSSNQALMACRTAPVTPTFKTLAPPARHAAASVIAQATASTQESLPEIPKPMLIQPSLRVEMNVTKPSMSWRELHTGRWDNSNKDLLPAGSTTNVASPWNDRDWFGSNRSRLRLPLGTPKPNLQTNTSLELTPLRISRTTF